MRALALAAVLAMPFASGCLAPIVGQIQRGDLPAVKAALAAGECNEGPGCAVTACISGQGEVLKLLLENGAPIEASTVEGALFHCVLHGRADMARLLLANNAQITARVLAIARRRPQMMQLLQTEIARRAERQANPVAESTSSGPARVPNAAAGAPSSDIDSPKARGGQRPDDFALVIGIEDYQSVPKADYGERDAAAARRQFAALGVPERNIISLTGQAATGSKLRSYLQQWLPRNVKPTSTVFVYYSGHGAPDPENGTAYLVPWDADPMFLTTTAYPLKQFYAELAKLKAKRVIVALDACFSGAGGRSVLAKGARPLVAKADESVPAADNLTVIAAASGSEITGSLDEQRHGIFTYHLFKALADGRDTPRALFEYLKPRVQDDARRQNREQTPTLSGTRLDGPLTP